MAFKYCLKIINLKLIGLPIGSSTIFLILGRKVHYGQRGATGYCFPVELSYFATSDWMQFATSPCLQAPYI